MSDDDELEWHEEEDDDLYVHLYPEDGDVFLGQSDDGEIACTSYEDAKNTLARLNLLLERAKIASGGG